MFIRSIRFKIILWYMLVLTLTLSLFSALLYQNLSKKSYDDLDQLLRSRAAGVIDSIDTYWEKERLESIEEGVKLDVFSKSNNINFAKIAQRWVEERTKDPRLVNIIIQIFDASGKLIASSKDIPDIMDVEKHFSEYVSKKNGHFETVDAEFRQGKQQTLRTFTIPVIEENSISYIVEVSSQTGTVEETLNNLRLLLFILLPLTVFVTGMIGAFLAKITLSPVDRMIDSIHHITAEKMKMRIPVPDTRDEIRRLADTFNEMLSRLENSFSSQRRFIEDLTHELKTPLAILKGELEVSLRRSRSGDEYDLLLRSNLEEVDRIAEIVEDLLMIARFDSNVITLETKPLDISVLVLEIAEDINILARQKNIDFNVYADKTLILQGDRDNLKRLFLNLLDNAIKYTPQSGRVEIHINEEQEFVKISISDSGIGISEEDIPHIFDRFYHVDKSRATSGFGLGLSIAKSIAEAHRGRIEAHSKSGLGSTFIVFLPLQR